MQLWTVQNYTKRCRASKTKIGERGNFPKKAGFLFNSCLNFAKTVIMSDQFFCQVLCQEFVKKWSQCFERSKSFFCYFILHTLYQWHNWRLCLLSGCGICGCLRQPQISQASVSLLKESLILHAIQHSIDIILCDIFYNI